MKKILLPIIAVSSLFLVACGEKEVAENGSPTETTIQKILNEKLDAANAKLKEQNAPMSFKLNSAKLESCENANEQQEYQCKVNIDATLKAGDKEKNDVKTSTLTFKKEADKWTVNGFL